VVISTCYAQTDHPAELYVFEGCDGDCLVPVANPENVACNSGFGQLVTVDTLPDQFYKVLVAGATTDKVGNHKISAEKINAPRNGACETPDPIVPGSLLPVHGTTLGASANALCGGDMQSVWCKFVR